MKPNGDPCVTTAPLEPELVVAKEIIYEPKRSTSIGRFYSKSSRTNATQPFAADL